MPEQRQITVEPLTEGENLLGNRRSENLRSAFPASPIHSEEITALERQQSFLKLALEGNVNDNTVVAGSTVEGGSGHGITSFDRDFSNAPDIEGNNQTSDGKNFGSGGGAPISPYVPSLTSPGPGSVNASTQPAFRGEVLSPEEASAKQFGVGIGSVTNPSDTSQLISEQFTAVDGELGVYIKGASYDTSNGNS